MIGSEIEGPPIHKGELDKVEQAILDGRDVPFAIAAPGKGGHAMVITDLRRNPDGTRALLISDPWEGATRWVHESGFFNGQFTDGNEFDLGGRPVALIVHSSESTMTGNAAGMGDISGFHGRAGGEGSVTLEHVQTGLMNLTQKMGGRMLLEDDPEGAVHVQLPLEDGQTSFVPVKTSDPSEMNEGAVAEFRIQANGEIEILVSSHAKPEHVEEALAHEFAEIKHLMKLKAAGVDIFTHGAHLTGAGALQGKRIIPGSTLEDVRDAMTPHDYGRVAQLDYIADRQTRGLPGGDTTRKICCPIWVSTWAIAPLDCASMSLNRWCRNW